MKRKHDSNNRGKLTDEEKDYLEDCIKRKLGSAFFCAIAQRVADMVSNEAKYIKRIKELEKDKDDMDEKIDNMISNDIADMCDYCEQFESPDYFVPCNSCGAVFCDACTDLFYICRDCKFEACLSCLYEPNVYHSVCEHIGIKCHSKTCKTLITKGVDSYECKLHKECPFLVCQNCHDFAK